MDSGRIQRQPIQRFDHLANSKFLNPDLRETPKLRQGEMVA